MKRKFISTEDEQNKRVRCLTNKRKLATEETTSNKRCKSYIQHLEQQNIQLKTIVETQAKENEMMKQACFDAADRIAQLETLLKIQRSQMDRIRVNNNITVY